MPAAGTTEHSRRSTIHIAAKRAAMLIAPVIIATIAIIYLLRFVPGGPIL
jgi:hypothetical protein